MASTELSPVGGGHVEQERGRLAAEAVAGEPALIATFYGPRSQRLQPIVECLILSFALTPHGADDWRNPSTQTFLSRFDGAAAYDTTIVQLALNAPGEADAAWPTMRQKLGDALDDHVLHAVWGYTLVYQAVLAPNVVATAALEQLRRSATSLHPLSTEVPQSLGSGDVLSSRIWLMDIPSAGDGPDAATVYVALGPPDPANMLVRQVLYGPGATLLMPDLIAHKGYHQIRQYRMDGLEGQYKKKLEGMRQTTGRLLNGLDQATGKGADLDNLAGEYSRTLTVVADLTALRNSLARQLHNYDWWRARATLGEVGEFHRSQLEAAFQELELMVSEGQTVLQTAGTAVDVVRARLDKEREHQEGRIETLLTVLIVALTVPLLIDKEVTRALLKIGGLSEAPTTAEASNTLLAVGAQVGFIVIFVAVTVLAMGLIVARRR